MICGAGGGFDLYTGLPLYFYLKPRVEAVFLGNLSFASLSETDARKMSPALVEVTADTRGSEEYFPEQLLCRWFRERDQDVAVYCLQRTGVVTLREAWKVLADELDLDGIVLADGGTDSLMRGDESGLGTPQEDLANIAAVHSLDIPMKVLSCLGFGVDTFDGVCHAHFLESVAALQKDSAFLGAFSLLPEMEEAQLYQQAIDYVTQALPGSPSVVNNSIVSALEGEFGDVHRTWRTSGSRLFISALMSMYWSFDLDAVARRCLYLKPLLQTRSYQDVERVIREFRESYPPTRPSTPLPY
jgi:hypothetical protein